MNAPATVAAGTNLAVQPVPVPVDVGVEGASARREHGHRGAKRENRVRTAHPRIDGFLIAADVLWPAKACAQLTAAGSLTRAQAHAVHLHLAQSFPAA